MTEAEHTSQSENASSAKSSMRKPAKANKSALGEHIRVVPLHQPQAPVVAANAKLTYRSGPLLQNAQVFTIFWGKSWSSGTSASLMQQLNQFFTDILVSPAIDQLAEYNGPGQAIGHGSLIGTKVISASAPAGSVTDSTIRTQLKKWTKAGSIPKTNSNTLYFIYLDPGIVSIMGGSRSCQSYCGYHSNVGKVFYAVMPYPSCSGCLGAQSVLDALTGTSSHELSEAITDPVPGSGWYDNTNGEIGDICAWKFKKVAGYNVQLEWSNLQHKCV